MTPESLPETAMPVPRCANCDACLTGPYCGACGQSVANLRQSLGGLLREAVKTHSRGNGQIFHTLSYLVTKPAILTRDYLAGRRAGQVAPLRMFLVVIIVFFFAGSVKEFAQPGRYPIFTKDSPTERVPALTPGHDSLSPLFAAWLNPRLQYAATHQREFGAAVERWVHELPLLFLPFVVLLLGLMFVRNRRFLLFDHAVFSMHSLSFLGLLFTVTTLLGIGPFSSLAGLLGLAAPVHLFVHFRGVYGTGVLGTLIRLSILVILSLIAFAFLSVAMVGLGLNEMGTAG